MKNLYLTDINHSEIINSENIFFLGDWIKENYDFEKKLCDTDYEIFNSKIFNKKKIYEIDQNHKKFKLLVFDELVKKLNVYHDSNYSSRYWQIILEPWYTHFFEAILYRWKIVEELLNLNINLKSKFIFFINNPVHFDYDHFYNDVCSDNHYNQFLFQKIINFLDKKKNIRIIYGTKHKFSINKKKIKKETHLLNFFFLKISRLKKYFFDLSIGRRKYVLLNILLKDFPFKDKKTFSKNINDILFNEMSAINTKKRQKLNITVTPNSEFEKFFLNILYLQIPISFLEDFKKLNKYLEVKVNIKPKCIISDMNYATNTIFKFWLANSQLNGTKLIISDHGGSYGLLNGEFINEQISDKSLRYFRSRFDNSFHVPIIHKLHKRKKNFSNKLLIITHGVSKYPHYVTTSPVSGQVLNQITIIKNFYKNLPKKIGDNFYIRPYQAKGWDLNTRYKEIFKNKVLINKKEYEKIFKNSKIIISTYPKTSFYESFLSGPSILLTDLNHFKIKKEYDEVHEVLRKNNMLFDNSFKASIFVSKVWNNVDDWWYSNDVQEALKIYKSYLAHEKKNSLKIWADLIKKA